MTPNAAPQTDEIREHAEYLATKFYSEDLEDHLRDLLILPRNERGAQWSDEVKATRLALTL